MTKLWLDSIYSYSFDNPVTQLEKQPPNSSNLPLKMPPLDITIKEIYNVIGFFLSIINGKSFWMRLN